MLEADDDVWDEIRVSLVNSVMRAPDSEIVNARFQNFMKSLMRMFADEDKGVIFFETVLTLKFQKHSFIECIPVPWEQFDVLPGYFKVRYPSVTLFVPCVDPLTRRNLS